MNIQNTIKDQIKNALRARDAVRLSVLRGLSAAFTNELVAKGKKPTEEITDEDALAVVKREANKRKDSIEQFTKGGRPELADVEAEELKIVAEFLPEMMSRDEILKIVIAKKEELGITDPSKLGMLMGKVMSELKGKADGSTVKEVVESTF